MADYSFYLCTDRNINKKLKIENCVEEAILGGVTIVQVREKNKSTNEICEIAKRIKKVTDKYKVPLIINDNIDVVKMINADGLHIGQDDISCIEARRILGDKKIIGVSVRNLKEALKAIEDGATYLGVGAIYKSRTKEDATIVKKRELRKILKNSRIPIVVIGGINEKTIPKFKGKKISGYAMIRPILEKENIRESAKIMKKLIINNSIDL